jgi:hypothetical protein
MDELDQVYELEAVNYAEARRVLGDGVGLVQDLIGLYTALTDYLKVSKIGPRDEIVVSSEFLMACRYQLVMGSLSVLRLHLTDSFYYVRKAIEFCAFAGRVKKHPHLAMVWLKAGESAKAYKDYREKFSPGKLFPQDDAVLGQLSQRYDHCCKMTHPSLFSVGFHTRIERTEKIFSMDFNYFDVKPGDPSEPFRAFLWIIDTHFGIVRIFEKVFADALEPVKQNWEEQRNTVDQRIGVFKAKWKPRIIA